MLNFLIRILSYFTKPVEGDPNQWLERQYNAEWREFICGSCRGLYRCENKEYQILAVHNTKKNDNFDKILEWFKKSCKRDNYKLVFLEVGNPRLFIKLRNLGFRGDKEKMILEF